MAPSEFEPMSQSTRSSQIQEELDYRVAIANCYLDLSEFCIRNHAYDDALKCINLAILLLIYQNRDLSSLRIETNLRAIANALPTENEKVHVESADPSRKPVCLHVLRSTSAFGGLIRMVTRWIQFDRCARTHSVVLLSQQSTLPPELVQAVSESGGTIYLADQKLSLLQKAAWLREIAGNLATYVILHFDHYNWLSAAAFGKRGGPSVLLVNHTAHLFWAGASAPDIVVNVRGSQLEERWTMVHRGANNCVTIPIPMLEPKTLTPAGADRDEQRSRAREIIGFSKKSILIMTSGISYKYKPFGELDFLNTCNEILEAVPEAFIVAAGVIEDDRWRAASNKLGFRLRALGSLPPDELALLHQASDVYIEGFPFGSTTALLEAGLQGLPVVLAPAECPPPYGSDGVALDDTLERPTSLEHYKSEVLRLCKNPAERTAAGIKLQKAILEHHTGAGWKRYLTNALQAAPTEHCVHPIRTPLRTPRAIYEYWSEFQETFEETRAPSRVILDDQIFYALSLGLRQKITPEIKLACKNARQLRAGGAIPLPLLSLLCNYCLPLLPLSWARIVFRIVKFFFRGGLQDRVRNKVVRLFGRINDSHCEYERYSYIKDYSQWFGAKQTALKESLNRE